MKKMQKMFQNAVQENVEKRKGLCDRIERRCCKTAIPKSSYLFARSLSSKQMKQLDIILKMWDVCFISIIHRTQFYLLFKGDPAELVTAAFGRNWQCKPCSSCWR